MRQAGFLSIVTAALLGACAVPSATVTPAWVATDLVGDGVFTSGIEGPAVGPDGALYVVNFGREGTIGRVGEPGRVSGEAALFVTLPAGSIGNGIRFLRDGRMLVADYRGHRILAVTPRGTIATYAELRGANQPNDIALAPDGDVYASDPDWKNGTGQIWRIGRSATAAIVEDGMGTTNGIEVSPDGHRLYVAESVQRRIWLYDRASDGSLSGKRLFASFPDHGLDGMRCDMAGNLYVTRHGAGKVAVLAPDGSLVREVALKGKLPSNLAFGGGDGRTVYVTLQDRGAIETFRSELPGREWRGAQAPQRR
ncbi:SMP-30/gluconolactonase/LRE family protein [Sphingomonas parva]|uniref:SMP-30/gluconolactonase/LRE family protein n=1 Tax=Sphingomonas parva TaxID=2555898 RepID=A0A4Y8ZVK6_9SPHN|nr:SMP-30/gluconolactonase/LRE family protein [Sphingomonas parva]TFI59954.1 SMP-30/gluconolactonase/LRE family protein [Sphingomonas parva]